jgi:hypothetical protein
MCLEGSASFQLATRLNASWKLALLFYELMRIGIST